MSEHSTNRTITLTAADGHQFSAYHRPVENSRGSLVVIQEIFGVNPHIRSVVDRYADAGISAIAPAVFDRVERGVELGYDGEAMGAGMALAARLDGDEVMADVAATIDFMAGDGGPVGIVGFCFGGTVAWKAAAVQPVAAAVGYYGGGIHSLIDLEPKAPVLLHFGALDAHIPVASVREVAAHHPEVTVHIYDDADHGFNCDARASYHADSAALARNRTLEFLAANGIGNGGAD